MVTFKLSKTLGITQVTVWEFSSPARPPFRLDLTAWALRRSAKNTVDSWDGAVYSRIFVVNGNPIKIAASQKNDAPEINARAESPNPVTSRVRETLAALLSQTLGLTVNLEPFYALAKKDENLREVVETFLGVKPPRFPTLFEALANAVACQQVSIESGLSFLNKLARKYGTPFQAKNDTFYSFPDALAIANASPEDLRDLGCSLKKSSYLIGLAARITEKPDVYSKLESSLVETIEATLTELKGIGRWSSEYAMLRGLGKLDVLPGDDVGFQKNLKRLLGLSQNPAYDAVGELTAKWRPYRGMVYFHLLLRKLAGKGLIPGLFF